MITISYSFGYTQSIKFGCKNKSSGLQEQEQCTILPSGRSQSVQRITLNTSKRFSKGTSNKCGVGSKGGSGKLAGLASVHQGQHTTAGQE
jgi:hypothetical protein